MKKTNLFSFVAASIFVPLLAVVLFCGCDQKPDGPGPEIPDNPPPVATASVGDFFYSDGTFSTDLDESKTPVGIVFWTGNPAAEDPTLLKDHPGCTHGLVIALDYELGDWQTYYQAYGRPVNNWIAANTDFVIATEQNEVNFVMGYNNTRALEAFNAAPANSAYKVNIAERVVEYRQATSAPANTSGWYIPSIVELALLGIGEFDDHVVYARGTANRDLIAPRLALLGERAMPLTETDVYWTSSENALSVVFGVWCFKMYQGMAEATSSRTSPSIKTRYVLAF